MTNEYAIQRTDIPRPTRHYAYANTPEAAEESFRAYTNITAPVIVTLLRKNIKTPLEDADV
jgi:hypothetical protein